VSATLTLYQLPEAFAELLDEIEANEGEMPPDLEARLDSLNLNLAERAEAAAMVIRQAEARAKFFGGEKDWYAARERSQQALAARVKAYLQATLEALGQDRVETPRFKIRLQSNSRPAIRWAGAFSDLPEPYRRVSVSLDGEAAYLAWRAGGLPEGFAVETGRHLRIG
jgi:hypothetical protein